MTGRQIAAILAIGVIGVLIPGLQPQLLGALAAEGRVSVATLGPLATAELLAMGVAAGAAGFVLPQHRLRAIAAAALVLTAAADLASPHVGTAGLFGLRIAAGLGEGALVWIAIGFIVRTARPERWSGIYLALQTLAQFAVASALGYGAASSGGGFATLAVLTACALPLLLLLPPGYVPLAEAGERTGALPRRGTAALLGVLLYLAFIVAVWVYVEPLAAARGVPAASIHAIAPMSLAMQVIGATAATLLAGRLRARRVVIAGALANLVLLAAMGTAPSPAVFLAASAAFGFLWLFVMPFQVPLVIAADSTRRAAVLIGGAQLAGSSLGPLAAGAVVDASGVVAVLWLGAATLVVGTGVLLAAPAR